MWSLLLQNSANAVLRAVLSYPFLQETVSCCIVPGAC